MLKMFYNSLKLCVFLIFLTELCGTADAASRTAKFKDATSRFSSKYFHNLSIFAKNDKVYLDFYLIKSLTMGMKGNLDIQLRLDNSKKYQTLFTHTQDICKAVLIFKDNLFRSWFKSLLKVGNFVPNCPVNSDHYYVNGWQIESSMVPVYLIPGDYRIRGYCYYGKFRTKSEDFVLQFEVDTLIGEA